jgi:DNA-directed RNA polymerase subunit alpha
MMIMLNLKQLRFKTHSDEPQKATLTVKGEKQVKASEFKIPSQIELINKTAPIATLTNKSAELEIEIQIEKGLGYEPADKRKKEKLESGVIALDAIFTPVKRVSFRVENMRVGERTDYDKLSLELETDGTIEPEQTFLKASEILVDHFSLLKDAFKPVEKEAKPGKKEAKKKTEVKTGEKPKTKKPKTKKK